LFEVVAERSNVGISGNVVLTVNGAVASTVRYWWDTDGDNEVDASDTVLGSSTTASNSFRLQFPSSIIGINPSVKIIARAENSAGEFSPVRSTTISISSLPPVSSGLRITPSTVARGTSVTLSLANVADPDGFVQAVSYFADTNGNGIYNAGTDLLLSRVTTSPFTLTVPTTERIAGNYVFFGIAEDNNGTTSVPYTSRLRVTESVPTLSGLKSSSVILGSVPELRGTVTLFPSAVPVDRDGTVTRLEYYRDTNGNSILDVADTLVGSVATPTVIGRPVIASDWQLNISELAASLDTGTYRFFARAVDNYENKSTVSTTTFRINARPAIGSFVVTLLGLARKSGTSWTLSISTRNFPVGSNRFQAVAFDNFGTVGETSVPVTTEFDIRNSFPTLAGIASKPTIVANRGEIITLSSRSPKDRDGTVTSVQYVLDKDGDGSYTEGADEILGESTTPGTFSLNVTVDSRFDYRTSATGPGNRIIARAFDNSGDDSNWTPAINVTLNAPPQYGTTELPGTTEVIGSPVANTRSAITVESRGIFDADGVGIASVEFVVRNQDGVTPDFVLGKGSFVAATGAYKFTGSITKPQSNNVIWLRITDKNKGVTFVNTSTVLNIT